MERKEAIRSAYLEKTLSDIPEQWAHLVKSIAW